MYLLDTNFFFLHFSEELLFLLNSDFLMLIEFLVFFQTLKVIIFHLYFFLKFYKILIYALFQII